MTYPAAHIVSINNFFESHRNPLPPPIPTPPLDVPNRTATDTPSSQSSGSLITVEDDPPNPILAPGAKYCPGYKFLAPLNVDDLFDQDGELVSPQTALNPKANPFVPKCLLRRPKSTASSEGISSPVKSMANSMPAWLLAFMNGARSSPDDSMQHAKHAFAIVSITTWCLEDLAELVSHIIWMACDTSSGKHHEGLIPLVLQLYKKFKTIHNPDVAHAFHLHLREHAIDSFKKFWDPVAFNSVSYRFAPTSAYVASALSLAAFVGDLLPIRIVSKQQVHDCLSLLLDGLASHEHVEAIHTFLEGATGLLWHLPGKTVVDKDIVNQFEVLYMEKAQLLDANTSVLDKKMRPGQIERRIQSVLDMLYEWVEEGPQPFDFDSQFVLKTRRMVASRRRLALGALVR